MFIHLLVLLCASVSVIATPSVVVTGVDVGGCALGFPVCCEAASSDYSEGTRCRNVPNVDVCSNSSQSSPSNQSTTTLCCKDVSTVNLNGAATNCTAYD
ncbi:uncharacterized protein BJ212DRAFT_1348770 [Suillus subaureus]|uniref:Hydrophobin n=1 Tax=Suillus subaureus TaxID=48587 RepID=A0A9P7ECS8_9AGAM|nr:uncharacterized protein BJ212DRAFT_1348770 [Suillus subaureus]KAG1818104.1 hypothetical protein BJ212DRAFT_1348770 [Suillus subaureus]